MKKAACALSLLGLFSLTTTAASDLQPGWRRLSGSAIKSAFSGKRLGDGAHYSHEYRSDGTFSGVEMARDAKGQWRVQGKELCVKRTKPRISDECFEVQIKGSEVRLLQNDYLVFEGQLSPSRKNP